MSAALTLIYALAISFVSAFLFKALDLNPIAASPSSSGALSSPLAQPQLQITCCLEGRRRSVWLVHGRLMLTVLGGLAEFERHLILSRTEEGRNRAKVKGIKFGRKPKLTKHQREEALTRQRNGETLTEIAKSYNVSHMTICRL